MRHLRRSKQERDRKKQQTYPGQTVPAERPEKRVEHDHGRRRVPASLGRAANVAGLDLARCTVEVDGNVQEAEGTGGGGDKPGDASARAVDDACKEDEGAECCLSAGQEGRRDGEIDRAWLRDEHGKRGRSRCYGTYP